MPCRPARPPVQRRNRLHPSHGTDIAPGSHLYVLTGGGQAARAVHRRADVRFLPDQLAARAPKIAHSRSDTRWRTPTTERRIRGRRDLQRRPDGTDNPARAPRGSLSVCRSWDRPCAARQLCPPRTLLAIQPSRSPNPGAPRASRGTCAMSWATRTTLRRSPRVRRGVGACIEATPLLPLSAAPRTR
jgi:hypothetical protein